MLGLFKFELRIEMSYNPVVITNEYIIYNNFHLPTIWRDHYESQETNS